MLYLIEIETKGKEILRAYHQHCCASTARVVVYLVCRTEFDFFVRFENSACCINARHVLAFANSVCLLAFSHSDQHVLASRLCAG